MIKLDLKDKKILYLLNKDCRLSDTKIAKFANLSKQVVNYRINRFIESGIIDKFIAIIDTEKLGYSFYNVYLELGSLSKEKEQNLISKFIDDPSTTWVISGLGRWNFIVCILAKNTKEFNKSLNKLFLYSGKDLIDYATFTVVEAFTYPYRILFKDIDLRYTPTYMGSKSDNKDLNRLDLNILDTISNNARMKLIDISKKLKEQPNLINYRLKNLISKKYIASLTTLMNLSKLNIGWYYVFLKVNYHSEDEEKNLTSYLKSLDNVFYIIKGVGNYNLAFEIHAEDTQRFKDILEDIKEKYKPIIRKVDTLQILKEYKCNFFPKTILEDENGSNKI
ncbi:MAG: Lrp/AsnC family transcriptional regulator [archaeon]